MNSPSFLNYTVANNPILRLKYNSLIQSLPQLLISQAFDWLLIRFLRTALYSCWSPRHALITRAQSASLGQSQLWWNVVNYKFTKKWIRDSTLQENLTDWVALTFFSYFSNRSRRRSKQNWEQRKTTQSATRRKQSSGAQWKQWENESANRLAGWFRNGSPSKFSVLACKRPTLDVSLFCEMARDDAPRAHRERCATLVNITGVD